MMYTKEEVTQQLTDLLNECLEGANQEYSFRVIDTDLVAMKFTVEFNIVINEDDNYIGFQGY
ncbi:MAG TPA: hypothetical protein P5136_01705 [Methanofastidiosum sp.]|nr:hypothetical protein [Methanofastidiosum sp.]